MNTAFDRHLSDRLHTLHKAGLHRELREVDSPQGRSVVTGGRSLINFSSNDYLGLSSDERIIEAGKMALDLAGAGSGASRLISGSHRLARDLETAIANLKGTRDALVFATGYAAAVGTIPSLIGREDVVAVDRLAHASLVDGARLSGAKLRIFRHNNPDDLERILKWASPRRTLIATESVFSMDGDLAPLRKLVDVKERFNAWLMVDEAHATGVFGERGEGLIGSLGLTDRVEVQMGTLGKALGSAGGCIAGSAVLRDLLINTARSFIFSTAPVPAQTGAAAAAIRLVNSPEGSRRRRTLRTNIALLGRHLYEDGWLDEPPASPIIPIMIGDETATMQFADRLRKAGFWVPAIRHPSVGRGKARLRITVTASHTDSDIRGLVEAMRKERP